MGSLSMGCPPPQPTRDLGERRELPSGIRGRAPADNGRIQGIFQGLRSLLVETMHYGVYGIVNCENY